MRWGGRGRCEDGRPFDVGTRTRNRLAATDPREPGSLRRGLGLDQMDASMLSFCSQPRVQRAATRFPWAVVVGVGGRVVVPHQAGRRSDDRKSEFKRGSSASQHVLRVVVVRDVVSRGRGSADGCWDGEIGDGRWVSVARCVSKFCQEEVRLSKTRHEARGTHEALAQTNHTNHKSPLWGGRHWGGCAHGAGKKRQAEAKEGRRRRRRRRC